MPADLDSLPRLNGFRLRGLEMTRLETFIDAAFAFAITMLVISPGEVPRDFDALVSAFRNVPAFIVSIATLGLFWRGHWIWSRRYGLEDTTSILVSWAMLAMILIYVYPLKLLFGGMFYHLSHRVGQPIGIRTAVEARAFFAIYASGVALISLAVLFLNLHAWRLRDALRLNERERWITRGELSGWSLPIGVGLISLVLALTLPVKWIDWSGWVFCSLIILAPIQRRWRKRQLTRVANEIGRRP
ncbi:MAG TPA: TMEM175 family protein [Chthoniobacterales bacterium]|nr:TMEM175 family protein [Chthoniobacterales bacterium]